QQPATLTLGLVDKPAVLDGVPDRSGSVAELRREPLHPPLDRHVVDFDAACGEQLLDVAVGQPAARVPAWRNHLLDEITGPELQAIVAVGANARAELHLWTPRHRCLPSRSRIPRRTTPRTCSTDGGPNCPTSARSSHPT